jgi:hypothetical protein
MSDLLKLPAPIGIPRVETGPVQFGNDWPGLFIRGDDAAAYVRVLDKSIRALHRNGLMSGLELAQLHDLLSDLGSSRVSSSAPAVVRMSLEEMMRRECEDRGLVFLSVVRDGYKAELRFSSNGIGYVVHAEAPRGPPGSLPGSDGVIEGALFNWLHKSLNEWSEDLRHVCTADDCCTSREKQDRMRRNLARQDRSEIAAFAKEVSDARARGAVDPLNAETFKRLVEEGREWLRASKADERERKIRQEKRAEPYRQKLSSDPTDYFRSQAFESRLRSMMREIIREELQKAEKA